MGFTCSQKAAAVARSVAQETGGLVGPTAGKGFLMCVHAPHAYQNGDGQQGCAPGVLDAE